MDMTKAKDLLVDPEVYEHVDNNGVHTIALVASIDTISTLSQLRPAVKLLDSKQNNPPQFLMPENLLDYPDDSPYKAIFITQCSVAAAGYEALVGTLSANVFEKQPTDLSDEERTYVYHAAAPMLPQTLAVHARFQLTAEGLEVLGRIAESEAPFDTNMISPDLREAALLILQSIDNSE